jgi:ribosomal-protein-alanine N-acetyltransferase
MPPPQSIPGPILVTDRLLMRPFQWSDLDVLAALASDPDVMRSIGKGPETREEVTQGMERAIRRWHEQGMSWWAVVDRCDAQVIGRCCLQHVRDLPEIEVGCAFARQHWGRGLASEAVRAALDHGFGVRGLRTVVALTHPEHTQSIRMLERCGFMRDATIPLRGKMLNLSRITAQTWAEHSPGPKPFRPTGAGTT